MDPTVDCLAKVLRAKPTERDLVSPCCHRVITLSDGKLWCWGGCGRSYATLAELVAVERKVPA